MDEKIAQEMTPQGDLLPLWRKHPEIPFGSIGWRMGYGEFYSIAWHKWASSMSQEQLVAYFKKYVPIPLEWLSWVANCFGFTEISNAMFSGTGEFAGIQWLEQQGLASFTEFQSWYENEWKKRIGKR